jgi:hypothetical protein
MVFGLRQVEITILLGRQQSVAEKTRENLLLNPSHTRRSVSLVKKFPVVWTPHVM